MLSLLLLVTLVAAPGDRPPPPGRMISAPAASRSASLPAFERFFVFGWCAPPADSTDSARVEEYARAGMNLMLFALEDSGRVADNRKRLDLAATHGMKCIVWDRRFERVDWEQPATVAVIDTIAADYRDHPAFLAYYLGDEPRTRGFPYLTRFFDEIHARDPAHPGWNNLSGRSGFWTYGEWITYQRLYLGMVHPAVLCNDHGEFLKIGDRGWFVENAAASAALAREIGVPFWSIVQLIEHGSFRQIGPGELRWQVSILLAYGARGIGYFTYWTPRPDSALDWHPSIIDHDGRPTEWYTTVAEFNRLVRPAGETLAGLTWLATVHAGNLPHGGTWFVPNDLVSAVQGRATLGYFSDSAGVPYLLVANSDSLSARRVTLTLPRGGRACVLDQDHVRWEDARCWPLARGALLSLDLEAGSFALLRLEGGATDGVSGGTAPGLALVPNPAGGEVRLAIDRVGNEGRVEIVDAGGRRMWSNRLPAGATTLTWRGEKEGGGHAPPGLYFARVEDERGVTARRLVWLGQR